MAKPSAARRDFLKMSLVAALPVGTPLVASTAVAQPQPEPGSDKLTAYQDGPQIWVRWANAPLTGYRAHSTQKYPYLYPFAGPATGLSVTAESAAPYPHHRSIFFACDRVNDGNYWQGPVELGQIVSKGPKLGPLTPDSAEISDECEWRKPGRTAVMTDTRRIVVRVVSTRVRWIDVAIEWTAVENVTIAKTNHALFAVRAAADLAPLAGGRLENSQAKLGEKETFGKPADWCTFYNKRAGVTGDIVEGIALFNHPGNPWAGSPWFTRDYGFISPNPFNFSDKPWQLAAGKSVQLRYRVVSYFGTPSAADLPSVYKAWIRE
jgi:hypothetical protein